MCMWQGCGEGRLLLIPDDAPIYGYKHVCLKSGASGMWIVSPMQFTRWPARGLRLTKPLDLRDGHPSRGIYCYQYWQNARRHLLWSRSSAILRVELTGPVVFHKTPEGWWRRPSSGYRAMRAVPNKLWAHESTHDEIRKRYPKLEIVTLKGRGLK